MSCLRGLSWMNLILMALIKSILSEEPNFNLWKTPQLPSNRASDKFITQISDRLLIDIQQVGNVYMCSVYNGELFEHQVNNYNWTQEIDNDIAFSSDSILKVRNNGSIIQSTPYLKPTVLNIPNVQSLLSLDQEVKLLSVYNDTTNCQYLILLYEFQGENKKLVFDKDEKECRRAYATLIDLGNGLIAHKKYDTVDIWRKNNFTNKLQSINISDNSSRPLIKDIKTLYDPIKNYSMFAIWFSEEIHTIYQYNATNNMYVKGFHFYYNGQCHYNSKSICVSIKNGDLIKNENIDKQIINEYMSSTVLEQLKGNRLFQISHSSSKYMIGYNSNKSNLNIFSTESDQIKWIRQINGTSCVKDAKFTDGDSDIITLNNCDNNTTNNLCRIGINSNNPYCLRGADDKNDSIITGYFELTSHSQAPNLNRICAITFKPLGNSYEIDCRSAATLSRLPNPQNLSVTLTNQSITGAKILHSKAMNENFWVLVSVIDSKNHSQSFAQAYNLKKVTDKNEYNIEKLFNKTINVSYDLSGAHQLYLITLYYKNQNQTDSCALLYINMAGDIIQNRLNYPCPGNNSASLYRLILQEGFNQECIHLLPEARIDCYKREGSDKMLRKSISVPQYNRFEYFKDFKPIINATQNWILFYQTYSVPSYVFLDISVLPIFRATLGYQQNINSAFTQYYANRYAYRSQYSLKDQKRDEILSYAQYQFLYKLRNPVEKMKLMEMDPKLRPQNYIFIQQRFTLEHPNPSVLKFQQKAFLASTGYHLIVLMYSTTGNTTINYLQFQQVLGLNRSIKVIWHYSNNTVVNLVDLAWNTFVISASKSSVEFSTFRFLRQIALYNDSETGDRFDKVQVASDDRLLYSIQKFKGNFSLLYFMSSLMKIQSYPVHLNFIKNVLSFVISPSQNAFFVLGQKHIEFILQDTPDLSTAMVIPDGLIIHEIYIIDVGYVNSLKKKHKFNKPDQYSQLSYIITSQHHTPRKDTSLDENNSKARFPRSPSLSPSAIEFLWRFVRPRALQVSNDKVPPTLIIRTENFTMFCSSSLRPTSDCLNKTSITASTIFAVQQDGNMIAYVQMDDKGHEVVHVMRVKTWSSIDPIQNISLRQLIALNSDLKYTPTIVSVSISANGTLYILTKSKDKPQYFNPVFYVYVRRSCGIDKLSKDGECVCEPYYWTNNTYKNGSKVTEFAQCHCSYFSNATSGECQCPTWNGYQNDTYSCSCPDESQQTWSEDKGYYCEQKPFPGLGIFFIILGVVVILIAVGVSYYFKWYCFKRCRKDNNDQLNEELIEENKTVQELEKKKQEEKKKRKEGLKRIPNQ